MSDSPTIKTSTNPVKMPENPEELALFLEAMSNSLKRFAPSIELKRPDFIEDSFTLGVVRNLSDFFGVQAEIWVVPDIKHMEANVELLHFRDGEGSKSGDWTIIDDKRLVLSWADSMDSFLSRTLVEMTTMHGVLLTRLGIPRDSASMYARSLAVA